MMGCSTCRVVTRVQRPMRMMSTVHRMLGFLLVNGLAMLASPRRTTGASPLEAVSQPAGSSVKGRDLLTGGKQREVCVCV